jgi:hypothetical protein
MRDSLLPLLEQGPRNLQAIQVPRSGFAPKYEGNVVALPLTWGVSGPIDRYEAARILAPLYHTAKNGVAYAIDVNGVLAKVGLQTLENSLRDHIQDEFGERAAMGSEYFEDELPGSDSYRQVELLRANVRALQNLKVKIEEITSPKSSLKGLRIRFSIPSERLPGGKTAMEKEANFQASLTYYNWLKAKKFKVSDLELASNMHMARAAVDLQKALDRFVDQFSFSWVMTPQEKDILNNASRILKTLQIDRSMLRVEEEESPIKLFDEDED